MSDVEMVEEDEFSLGSIQELIDSGMAWKLEGSVGRAAMAAIEDGYAMLGPERCYDYYGNLIPSRFDVQEGTKGSEAYMLARQAERDGD